ncbi:choice-of-anchor M domain-containing protein [Acidipropionibacterium acidipropionici]|uniref:choice-of-anchor M domain-containing protein n=1 Tax=Acidipropionibacterium acidipropionici TaxID=1748 RepID=UPI00040EF228|nr:choice-of-anchor M domain-containing protein [Acidipropionibacterium acidipropionici]ALN15249.1 hypothetical protein ASQ49_08215 [Acidipropionibacterium acidipropionici]APZ09002.1 hypothetical protein BWX38_06705 [Acidipropionibacterium acidipropionici]
MRQTTTARSRAKVAVLALFISIAISLLQLTPAMAIDPAAGRTVLGAGAHVDAIYPQLTGKKFEVKSLTPDGVKDTDKIALHIPTTKTSHVGLPEGYEFLGKKGTKAWVSTEAQDKSVVWPGWSFEGLESKDLKGTIKINYKNFSYAGDMIHLIPQTQAEGVLWLGWNTQHSSVRAADPRTITFAVSKKQGPGDLHIYLDYGGFRPPRQLWGPGRSQPVSVPVDTHTHANWAFSEPGRYVVDFTAQITEKDGSRRSATGQLQFLVGDEAAVTSPTGRWEVWGPTALAIGLVVVAALVTIRRILRH